MSPILIATIFLIGVACGFIICSTVLGKVDSVGTLKVFNDEIDGAYLFLEANKPIEFIAAQEIVTLEVKVEK